MKKRPQNKVWALDYPPPKLSETLGQSLPPKTTTLKAVLFLNSSSALTIRATLLPFRLRANSIFRSLFAALRYPCSKLTIRCDFAMIIGCVIYQIPCHTFSLGRLRSSASNPFGGSFWPDVPTDIPPQTSSKSWKKKHVGGRTSTKKLRSEKNRAEFSFPRLDTKPSVKNRPPSMAMMNMRCLAPMLLFTLLCFFQVIGDQVERREFPSWDQSSPICRREKVWLSYKDIGRRAAWTMFLEGVMRNSAHLGNIWPKMMVFIGLSTFFSYNRTELPLNRSLGRVVLDKQQVLHKEWFVEVHPAVI